MKFRMINSFDRTFFVFPTIAYDYEFGKLIVAWLLWGIVIEDLRGD